MSVVYTVVDGVMWQEDRGGTITQYVPDTLGSVVAEMDEAGQVTHTADYWPYGEVRAETGTKKSPFGFVGVLGYMKDFADALYVRARYLRARFARWQTFDPLWPYQAAFSYARNMPSMLQDYSGMEVITLGAAAGYGATAAVATLGAPVVAGVIIGVAIGLGVIWLLNRDRVDPGIQREIDHIGRCREASDLTVVPSRRDDHTEPVPLPQGEEWRRGCSDVEYYALRRNYKKAISYRFRNHSGATIGESICELWGVLPCPGVRDKPQNNKTVNCLKHYGIDLHKIKTPKPKPGCDCRWAPVVQPEDSWQNQKK